MAENMFTSPLKGTSSQYKMEYNKKTVIELRNIAKQRGMVGYTRLRKADLIEAILTANDKMNSVLDAHVPDIGIPTLVPKNLLYRHRLYRKYSIRLNLRLIHSQGAWIDGFIPEEPKRTVNEKLEALKAKVNSIFAKNLIIKHEIRETASAIKNFTKQYTVDGVNGVDAMTFLDAVQPQAADLLNRNRQTKVNFVLTCTMERVDMKSGEVDSMNFPFVSKTEVVLDFTSEIYNNAKGKMLESMAAFQMRDSNWRLRAVEKLDINTTAYKPLKGSSYIPMPKYLASKKAIVNMKNDDEECFKWCVTRALNPVLRDSERITKELIKQSAELDWSGIEFPVAADANVISKFERNNNVSINVFGYEEDEGLFPIYLSKHENDG